MSLVDVDTLHFASFRVDRARQQLWDGGRLVTLRPKTWELLLHLLQRPGEVLTVQELLEAMWPVQDVTPKALTNRIVELRRALGDDVEQPRIIQTLHRRGYRLIASLSTAPQFAAATVDAPLAEGPLPAPQRCFVGRERELAALASHAQAAQQGHRQLVLLSGEAGMGKSALIDAFLAGPAPSGALLGRAVCLEQSSEREAFGPWLSMLADLAAGPGGAQVLMLLRRCAPSWLVQLPWLLPADEAQQLRHSLQGTGAGRMLREACALLEALSQVMPLLLVLEDLHWSDAASIDLLAHVAQGRGLARLLVLCSARSGEAALRAHPYTAATRRLLAQGQAAEVALTLLQPAQVADCVRQRFGAGLGDSQPLMALLQNHSEGHPLYLSATLDHLVERGWLALHEQGWQWTVDAAQLNPGLPEALRQTIEARLSLLHEDALRLLQAASVIGMQLPLPLLQAVLEGSGDTLQAACETLVRGPGFLRALPSAPWPGDGSVPVFGFGHDAYRRVLYEGLGTARRQSLHRRVAQALEAAWQGRLHEVAAPLAAAFERSAQPAAAARVLELAAGVAAQRYAYREAAESIEAALRQLGLTEPGAERNHTELRLQLALANLRGVTRGHARADQHSAYRRAHEIASLLAEPRAELRSCMGLCITTVLAGRADEAQHWGHRLVALADAQLPTLRSAANCYAGLAELMRGAIAPALACFELSLSLDAEPGVPVLMDTHGLAGTQRAWALALAGRLPQARAQLEATLTHCRAVCKPLDLGQNLYWLASTLLLLGDTERAIEMLGEVQLLAEEQDMLTYQALARANLQAALPAPQRGAELELAVREHAAVGEDCYSLSLQLLLAETRLVQGDAEGAAAVIDAAAGMQTSPGIHAGELLRVHAAVQAGCNPALLSPAQDAVVRRGYLAAIDKNLELGTRTFALRAATALLLHARQCGDADVESAQLDALLRTFPEDETATDVLAARAALGPAAARAEPLRDPGWASTAPAAGV